MEEFEGFEKLPEVRRFLAFAEGMPGIPVQDEEGLVDREEWEAAEDEYEAWWDSNREKHYLLLEQAREAVEEERYRREEEEEELERMSDKYHP